MLLKGQLYSIVWIYYSFIFSTTVDGHLGFFKFWSTVNNAFMNFTDGEENGNPLQYSFLDNNMDKGAWWATFHGVAKSQTRLSD